MDQLVEGDGQEEENKENSLPKGNLSYSTQSLTEQKMPAAEPKPTEEQRKNAPFIYACQFNKT